jgi:hypothetical protein
MTEDTHIERIAEKAKKICGHDARLGLHTENLPDGKLDTLRSFWTVSVGAPNDRKVITQQQRLDLVEKFLDSYRV